ncbi:hypothetical protein [Clostridium oryzae]|uniref:hypothetical protein n=1 Tax=Clostridium oryzae TaxID=1450648 RepID=UPI0014764041|nr:hypothetical protein [Clostridium oryzae]
MRLNGKIRHMNEDKSYTASTIVRGAIDVSMTKGTVTSPGLSMTLMYGAHAAV